VDGQQSTSSQDEHDNGRRHEDFGKAEHTHPAVNARIRAGVKSRRCADHRPNSSPVRFRTLPLRARCVDAICQRVVIRGAMTLKIPKTSNGIADTITTQRISTGLASADRHRHTRFCAFIRARHLP